MARGEDPFGFSKGLEPALGVMRRIARRRKEPRVGKKALRRAASKLKRAAEAQAAHRTGVGARGIHQAADRLAFNIPRQKPSGLRRSARSVLREVGLLKGRESTSAHARMMIEEAEREIQEALK